MKIKLGDVLYSSASDSFYFIADLDFFLQTAVLFFFDIFGQMHAIKVSLKEIESMNKELETIHLDILPESIDTYIHALFYCSEDFAPVVLKAIVDLAERKRSEKIGGN